MGTKAFSMQIFHYFRLKSILRYDYRTPTVPPTWDDSLRPVVKVQSSRLRISSSPAGKMKSTVSIDLPYTLTLCTLYTDPKPPSSSFWTIFHLPPILQRLRKIDWQSSYSTHILPILKRPRASSSCNEVIERWSGYGIAHPFHWCSHFGNRVDRVEIEIRQMRVTV